MTAAPLPLAIVEKGLASDTVVIDVVIRKYVGHFPLYRQSEILHREAGVDTGRATLDGWVLRVGELLLPVAEAMAPRAWASSAWVRPRCLRRAARRRPNGVAGSPAALALHW